MYNQYINVNFNMYYIIHIKNINMYNQYIVNFFISNKYLNSLLFQKHNYVHLKDGGRQRARNF